jgi:uncharacterized membrane protein
MLLYSYLSRLILLYSTPCSLVLVLKNIKSLNILSSIVQQFIKLKIKTVYSLNIFKHLVRFFKQIRDPKDPNLKTVIL